MSALLLIASPWLFYGSTIRWEYLRTAGTDDWRPILRLEWLAEAGTDDWRSD
jgi:hypothetical protein